MPADPVCSICGRARQDHDAPAAAVRGEDLPDGDRITGVIGRFHAFQPPRPRTVGELVALLSRFPADAEVMPDGMAADVVLVAVSRSYADDQEDFAEAPRGPVVLEVSPADGWPAYKARVGRVATHMPEWRAEPCWCNGPWDRTRTHGPSACPRIQRPGDPDAG